MPAVCLPLTKSSQLARAEQFITTCASEEFHVLLLYERARVIQDGSSLDRGTVNYGGIIAGAGAGGGKQISSAHDVQIETS